MWASRSALEKAKAMVAQSDLVMVREKVDLLAPMKEPRMATQTDPLTVEEMVAV